MKTKTLILSLSMLLASFAPNTCHADPAIDMVNVAVAGLYGLIVFGKVVVDVGLGVAASCCIATPLCCILGYKCCKSHRRKKHAIIERKKRYATIEREELEQHGDESGETRLRRREFVD